MFNYNLFSRSIMYLKKTDRYCYVMSTSKNKQIFNERSINFY